jgi:hypothetical protein
MLWRLFNFWTSLAAITCYTLFIWIYL